SPVVLVVDDAQWGDTPSLRWLAYLAKRLDGVGMGVVVGWRTGEPAAADDLLEVLRSEPTTATLSPSALSEAASAQVAIDVLGPGCEPEFCLACHQATGGNPFLLHALLDAISSEELQPTAEAAERIRELGPQAVRRNILLRLSRLGEQ